MDATEMKTLPVMRGNGALARFDSANLPVAHVDDAVGDGGGLGIVGDHEHGLPEFAVGEAEHVEDRVGVFGVEIAGRLVGENDGGLCNQRAGDRNALLFAAGKLGRAMVEAAGDVEQLGKAGKELRVHGLGALGDLVGDFNVGASGERGKEVELLEDESDAGAAHFGPLGIGEGREVDAADENAAGTGAGEAAEQVEKGGFAAAGWSDDGDKLAGFDGKGRVAKSRNFEFAAAVGFAEVLGGDHGGHGLIVKDEGTWWLVATRRKPKASRQEPEPQ